MTDKQNRHSEHIQAEDPNTAKEEHATQSRRKFLSGLGKWSKVVIAGALVGSGALLTEKSAQAAGWINRRGGGGGWLNGRGGGGGSWVNRRGGGWGGSWINRR
ncbi:MAG: hypothetical protein V2J55_12910 [Candidatus Competibacteraceae bacterium]|jgi:hypothetical protein|nr:hypothetical protein [Candidatus Competibacteraceae bacterium]